MNTTTNDFKGLWIPFQILTDDNLSDKEKFFMCFRILLVNEFRQNVHR